MISNDKYKAIAELDLSAIKLKLTHTRHGEGWSQAKADAMEIEYRRFLYLQSAFPDEQTAPTIDVDTFWHYHILDTVKYAADCEQAFGYFLHHYPYVGLLEGDEPDVEIKAGNRTRALYEACFGEAYIRAEAYGEEHGESEFTAIQKGMISARCGGVCVRFAGNRVDCDARASTVNTGQSFKASPITGALTGKAAKWQFPCINARTDDEITSLQTASCEGLCVREIGPGKGAKVQHEGRPYPSVNASAITRAQIALAPGAASTERRLTLQAA